MRGADPSESSPETFSPDRAGRAPRSSDVSGERARVLELLQRFGWNATSFQCLQPGFAHWFEGTTACVAYVDTGRAWVAAGAPICDEAALGAVARAFVRAASEQGRAAVFFATERRFADSGFERLLIGAQPVYDPQRWPETLRRTHSLREQLRRGRAKGVQVSGVRAEDVSAAGAPLRLEVEALIAAWRRAKPMPPMGFLVRVDPFDFAHERRLFVARRKTQSGESLVGFAAVVPVFARGGWFIENLIRAPDAPNGTAELLVDAALRDAADRGSRYVTLGLSPLAGAVPSPLHLARKYASALYDFAGLEAFKAKFRPHEWAPIYLSHPRTQSGYAAVYHSLVAFSRHGLLRYGIETLLRGPDIVLRILAVLLVPWTLLLASIDAQRWFPAAWVHWSWVAFDIGLCVALYSLSTRYRPWLSRTLVVLVSADAALTTLQALVFNLPRLRNPGDALVLLVALLAPAVASLILASAHRRRARVDATTPPAMG